MLTAVSKNIRDVSVLRRLLFAVSQLPDELPDAWKLAVEFANRHKRGSITDEATLKVIIKNLEEIDPSVFKSDSSLFLELISSPKDSPLGVTLVSPVNKCIMCGSPLHLRKDRPSSVIIYDDTVGTIPGSHFHKICRTRSCGFTQYYGYYTKKGSTQVCFNDDWESMPYFVSSRETVFSLTLMRRFEAEVLLGQLSFKQCAEVYNHLHNCDIPSSQVDAR